MFVSPWQQEFYLCFTEGGHRGSKGLNEIILTVERWQGSSAHRGDFALYSFNLGECQWELFTPSYTSPFSPSSQERRTWYSGQCLVCSLVLIWMVRSKRSTFLFDTWVLRRWVSSDFVSCHTYIWTSGAGQSFPSPHCKGYVRWLKVSSGAYNTWVQISALILLQFLCSWLCRKIQKRATTQHSGLHSGYAPWRVQGHSSEQRKK